MFQVFLKNYFSIFLSVILTTFQISLCRDVLGEDEDLGLDTDLPSASKEEPEEDEENESESVQNGGVKDEDADIMMEYGLEDYDNEGAQSIS